MKKIIFGNRKNVIGQTVRRLRIEQGLSQGELAARLQVKNINIDQQMVSRIENNDRIVTDYELGCLCVVLDIESRDILADFFAEQLEQQ